MTSNGLHHRLRTVVGQRTYRELSELTCINAETVRRYVLGQPPSVDFVMGLCKSQGVNPTWLLTGDGPMRASEVKSFALRDANAHELLAAVAFTLERLAERVGRLEVFLQTMETRLRARLPAPEDACSAEAIQNASSSVVDVKEALGAARTIVDAIDAKKASGLADGRPDESGGGRGKGSD